MAYVKWNGCREAVAVDAASITPIPDGVSDEAAAGLTITYGTAMHGLIDRGRLRPGETVVVLGATGGAGLAAVEVAHLLGARVIAAGTSDDKLAICREHGAADLLNLNTCGDLKDAIRALTGGAGADMIYDCIGGPYAEPALRSTAWQGRYLVVGFAAGDIPRIPLNLLLLKGCELVGVFFGRFVELHPDLHRAHMAQVLNWCAEGKLRPHIDRVVALEDTAEALPALERREVKGKVIVRV
jgi:NADPH2:quinone reductase